MEWIFQSTKKGNQKSPKAIHRHAQRVKRGWEGRVDTVLYEIGIKIVDLWWDYITLVLLSSSPARDSQFRMRIAAFTPGLVSSHTNSRNGTAPQLNRVRISDGGGLDASLGPFTGPESPEPSHIGPKSRLKVQPKSSLNQGSDHDVFVHSICTYFCISVDTCQLKS